jgi:hypothetical protein
MAYTYGDTTLTSTAATIIAANDLGSPPDGRHYLMVQNTGTTNPMNLAIGKTATSASIYLGPGDSWVVRAETGGLAPGGYISAISASGTTCAWVSY